ncbi:MAG: hypothetical protein R3D29_09660 [Nitratireductor sp.]
MLLASGVNHGFARQFRTCLALLADFAFLLACIGLGLAQVFERAPTVFLVLTRRLRLSAVSRLENCQFRRAGCRRYRQAPDDLSEAAAFQWVNPKAWVMAVSAMTVYTSHGVPLRRAC